MVLVVILGTTRDWKICPNAIAGHTNDGKVLKGTVKEEKTKGLAMEKGGATER